MPHFIRNSIAESPASASTSLSFSSPPRQPSDSSPWLDIELEDIQGPEYPGSRIKRLRTALSSPSLSPTQGIAHVTERKTFQSATTAQAPSTPPRFMQKQSAVEDVSYLPTPPDSQHSGGSEDSLLYSAIPGPLLQSPLTPPSSNVRSRRSLRRPWIGTTPILASTTSPDRYISSRSIPQDSSGSFRLGKAPHLLSPDEKLLRNHSATPDPFLSSPRRTRHGRALTSSIDSRSATRSQARSTSSQDGLLTPHHAHPPPQYRQASLGTIWNVGGGPHQPTGPVQGISDGRGGLIGSGTNSPLYTAKFSEKDAPEDDQEIYENRLAAALDIDRTRKVLDLSRPGPQKAALLSTKRKRGTFVGRTQWRYGEWAREGDISRESDSQYQGKVYSIKVSSCSESGETRIKVCSDYPVPSLRCTSAQRRLLLLGPCLLPYQPHSRCGPQQQSLSMVRGIRRSISEDGRVDASHDLRHFVIFLFYRWWSQYPCYWTQQRTHQSAEFVRRRYSFRVPATQRCCLSFLQAGDDPSYFHQARHDSRY